jgi:hypothetical protein
MSSFQTGATQFGSFALSVFSLNGARFAGFAFFAIDEAADSLTAFFATFFAATFLGDFFALFFATFLTVRFAAFFACFFLVELRRFSMKCLAAPRAVNGSRLLKRVLEVAPAVARRLECVVPTDNTMTIVHLVRAKAAADAASLRY